MTNFLNCCQFVMRVPQRNQANCIRLFDYAMVFGYSQSSRQGANLWQWMQSRHWIHFKHYPRYTDNPHHSRICFLMFWLFTENILSLVCCLRLIASTIRGFVRISAVLEKIYEIFIIDIFSIAITYMYWVCIFPITLDISSYSPPNIFAV